MALGDDDSSDFPEYMQKHSQKRVQNPVKTQSSGPLGKSTDKLRSATTIFIEGYLQTLDTALLQEACFLLFGFGWVFF